MEIAVIGVNHQSAPIHIREKFSFTDTNKIEVLNRIVDSGSSEAVILSTCNRSETYISSMNLCEGIEHVKQIIKDFCNIDEVEEYLFVKEGLEAITHLHEVAAGLHSIVVGEDQILGQVKDAHEFAMTVGTTGKVLNKLFREAVTTAKKIKSETHISEYPLSISSIGIKFMREKMGVLQGKNILLIGASKMNRLALNHLYEEEVGTIYIANRTRCKVEAIKQEHPDIIGLPYEKRYDILECVDLVITSTSSPHVILKAELIQERERPLYILDMALPRDVEEEVGEVENVYLYNIDALKEISHQNSVKRNQLAQQAESFITESIEAFYSWSLSTKVDPTIRSIHERCDEIQEDTMNYLKRKINFSTKEEKLVEKMLMSSLHRLMREPIAKLKEIRDSDKQTEYITVIEDLFDL